MSNQKHPWCSDVSRDEAIRRAEDAAAAERPALPDHRDLPAAVAELRERVARLEQCATAGLLDRLGDSLPADVTTPREAAPGSREGVSADGIRKERVTLEVTMLEGGHKYHGDASSWDWKAILRHGQNFFGPGESVRVVEEANADDVAGMEYRGNSVARYWHDEAKRLTAERDAALRERDRLKSSVAALEVNRDRIRDELNDLLAQARAERDAAKEECEDLRRKKEHNDKWLWERVDRAEARVAELEAAPAANAGGEANCPAAPDSSQEPVAWGVLVGGKIERYAGSDALFVAKDEADDWCGAASLRGRGTVVPLYAAPVAESATTPQPPRGWLTEEEREAIQAARANFSLGCIGMPEDGGWYKLHKLRQDAMTALLSRSTPPLVRRPKRDYPPMPGGVVHTRDKEWIAAIREAGGEVG